MTVRRLIPADRQPDSKAGFAGARFKFDFTAMTVGHDAVADDQPKTSAGADGFGGEERFEQVRLRLRRNPRPIVNNLNQHLVVFVAGPDTNLAGALDRVYRVINEIGPHLVEFASVGHDARRRAVKGSNQRDVFQFVAEHGQSALDALVNVHLLHRRLVHVRIGFHSFDQISNPAGALLDLAYQ